jgi:very-short-patch-repair endonuclease
MKNQYAERTFTCIGCQKETTKRTPKNSTKYCSIECFRSSKKPHLKKGEIVCCESCGKETYKEKCFIKKNKNNFCSVDCANKFQSRNKIEYNCKICNCIFKWSPSRALVNNPTYCSIECRNKDTEFMFQTSVKGNLAQINKKGLNKLELKGNDILDSLGIKYQNQVPMFNKFIVDVLLDNKKIIIQWDGTYWHEKSKRKSLDISQDKYLNKCGYKVIRITDKQIKNNIEEVYEIIKNTI